MLARFALILRASAKYLCDYTVSPEQSLTSPLPVVGAAVPGFSKFILLALGYVFAGIQLVGFFGIFKEKPTLFKKYIAFNTAALIVSLSAALAFIGISAGRHQPAVDECSSSFFSSGNQTTTTQDETEGQQICNIFTWVVLGIMGALWVVLFIIQVSGLPLLPCLLIDQAALDLFYFRLAGLWCYSKSRSHKVPVHLFSDRRGPEHCAERARRSYYPYDSR